MENEYTVNSAEFDRFSEMIYKIGVDIETKNTTKNQEMKKLLQSSRRNLVDMMDESYQDAFNVEIRKSHRRT